MSHRVRRRIFYRVRDRHQTVPWLLLRSIRSLETLQSYSYPLHLPAPLITWCRGSGLWARGPGRWHRLQGCEGHSDLISHYLSKLNPQHWGAVISVGWFLFSVLMGTLTVHNHLTDSACTGDHWPVQQRVSCGGQTEILPKWFTFIEVDSVRKGSFEWTVRTLDCF